MTDPHPNQPDEADLRDVAALADGSLPGARRAEVEARVAGSPLLGAELERQRRAVSAIRGASAEVRAPATLRERIEAAAAGAGESRPAKRGDRAALVDGLAGRGAGRRRGGGDRGRLSSRCRGPSRRVAEAAAARRARSHRTGAGAGARTADAAGGELRGTLLSGLGGRVRLARRRRARRRARRSRHQHGLLRERRRSADRLHDRRRRRARSARRRRAHRGRRASSSTHSPPTATAPSPGCATATPACSPASGVEEETLLELAAWKGDGAVAF